MKDKEIFEQYKQEFNIKIEKQISEINKKYKFKDKDGNSLSDNDIKSILQMKSPKDCYDEENIKNFLRYRIGCTVINTPDYDIYIPLKKAMKEILENKAKKDNIECKVNINEDDIIKQISTLNPDRYILINGKIFETDTANSYQSIFGAFMRIKNKKLYLSYQDIYKINSENSNAQIYRDFNLLCILNNENNPFKIENEIYKKLCKFAHTYHNISNIVLVPVGYNHSRGKQIEVIEGHNIYDSYKKGIEILEKQNIDELYINENIFNLITGRNYINLDKKDKILENKLDSMIEFIENREKDLFD